MSFCGWLKGLFRRPASSSPSLVVETLPLRSPAEGDGDALPDEPVPTWEQPVDKSVEEPTLASDSRARAETLASDSKALEVPPTPYGAPLHPESRGQSLPVDVSGYGRQHSSSGRTWAIDVSVPAGWRVRSVGRARVVRVSDASDTANGVGVWTELLEGPLKGYTVADIHLTSRVVEVGQVVDLDEVVGFSGNTGASTGPHLHAEIAGPNGELVDPMEPELFGWAEAGWTWEGW